MKNLSAAVAGLVPALLMWSSGAIDLFLLPFLASSLGAVALCLLTYWLLDRWHHGGVLVLLILGIPALCYVYVALRQPIFLPLFWGAALLALLTSLVGAMIGDTWSWRGIGKNLAFFAAVAFVIIAVGSQFGVICAEGGMMAAGAFGVTRLCQIDLLSWLARLPGWVYRGLKKLWL